MSRYFVYALAELPWTLAARRSRGWAIEWEFLADWFVWGAVVLLIAAGAGYWWNQRK